MKKHQMPPWMEGKKEAKTGKSGSAAHEKGESAKFKAAEAKGAAPKGRPFADGGLARPKNTATAPKTQTKTMPKAAGNARGVNGPIRMANGGKARC